jgi:hypothetical protein
LKRSDFSEHASARQLLVLVLVLGLAIVIVIVLDTRGNSAKDAADMAHQSASASGPQFENEYEHATEHDDDDCKPEPEHEHEHDTLGVAEAPAGVRRCGDSRTSCVNV